MHSSDKTISRAMIFAAGLGTRYKPWTDHHPKALAPVNGKSLLQRNIEYLQGFGIRDIVVNVHHFADQIIEALHASQGWGSRITISDETTEVLETGGGLVKAQAWLESAPFVAMNVDILTDLDLAAMIESHFTHRPLATLAVTDRTTSRYFLFDHDFRLQGWRNVQTGQEKRVGLAASSSQEKRVQLAAPHGPEKRVGPDAPPGPHNTEKDLQQRAFSGIHIIDPALFKLIRQKGKFSTVDMYLDLGADHVIKGFDHSGGRLIDVGKPEAADKAALLFP